ncbi:MAG TPA: hypothetical protein VLN61_04205 [Pseudolabrys sp.]|nr:hypothetical protein [Pseudolabrys sp.]
MCVLAVLACLGTVRARERKRKCGTGNVELVAGQVSPDRIGGLSAIEFVQDQKQPKTVKQKVKRYGPLTQSPKVNGTRIIQAVDVIFRIRHGAIDLDQSENKKEIADLARHW